MSAAAPARICSMTGFARVAGALAPYRWAWELKTVNAKGLDIRLRLPPGFDAIETGARAVLGKRLARGTCMATLTATRESAATRVRIDMDVLNGLLAALGSLPPGSGVAPATLDGLLAVPGVVQVGDAELDDAARAALNEAALRDLEKAADALVEMRRGEGEGLARIVETRLAAIARLTESAESCPGRRPEAIRARLAETLAALLDASAGLDPVRLHQEAVLMAARADIREELDRLVAHVAAARDLVAAGGPVGRRLDFLAQELAREANTLCAKANDVSLTAIGLDLKTEIEQFREQVQNLE